MLFRSAGGACFGRLFFAYGCFSINCAVLPYNSNVSSTIQVQQMVVRDEQDIRSLAVEIATLTRRQQRGKGLRMA